MPTTTPTNDQPTRRRRWVIAALLFLALLGLLAASLGQGSPTAASPEADGTSANGGDADKRGASDAEADEAALEAAEQPVELDVDLVDGDADHDPDSSDFGDGGASADPCAEHDSADGSLLVGPDPLVLPNGDMVGQIHVRNCGADDIAWVAATKPSVTLATSGGTLDPGEVFPIELTIDGSQWEPGAIDFKVKVSEASYAHNTYVDVHAFRPMTGADMVASTDFSAGPGVGGCGNQCITKAAISTGYSSPDVGLDVATTVPAAIRVYLSTNPPIADQDGNPTFGTAPKAISPNGVQSWKTTLAGLAPTTKYFIIVKATDADGDVAYRHGSFKTVTPVQQDGGFAVGGDEPGCAAGCITKATITPGHGSDPAKVVVRTHTPAYFHVMLDTEPPTTVDGHPHFETPDVWHTSGLDFSEAWDHEVKGLQPATKYFGIITATDANGHRSYATGHFTTDGVDIVITMHKVHVVADGDPSWKNRGELSFAWSVDGQTTGVRGERKMHSGDEITFAEHERTYTVHDAKGTLPTVVATAFERDADGLVEFCSDGMGVELEHGRSYTCDWKWNAAHNDGAGVQAGDLAHLPDCAGMGVEAPAADGCLRIESQHVNDDYPDIWAIVSYTYVD